MGFPLKNIFVYLAPYPHSVFVEFTAASGHCRRKRPYFGLDQQVPRVAGKEYVVTRGTTEDTWTGFASRNSLRACLLKDLEYPLVERARNSVLVASMKSPWCLLQGCGLLMAKVRHHPAGPEFMVEILFVRCDQRLDFWGQCVHGRSPSGSGSERWGLRITIHSAILKMGCQFKSPVVLLQVPSSLLQEILVGPLCWDKCLWGLAVYMVKQCWSMFLAVALVQWTWSLIVEKRWEGRRLEKLTSGTQIPALGKRSSAVSTAALIWADKVCPWVNSTCSWSFVNGGNLLRLESPRISHFLVTLRPQSCILLFVWMCLVALRVSGSVPSTGEGKGTNFCSLRSMSRSVSIGASKMESVSTTQQGFSLGEEVTVVGRWAERGVTILLIPPFLCQLTPFERIWVEQCHWPSVKQVDLQQEEEGGERG
ncbi:hypothetical protein D4764_05G0000440 [Takifugu flavidus]|uniref:Uncharacterized protein n=1 Tax=Takifugu flavidus TaxID=433684 RepID=A0A5C6MXA6_9TELE|nr:hypothetical protein D4764_05G0000440 [Takifugu flavidus]